MPCELCGKDASLVVVRDIYDRIPFRICKVCHDAHTRVRPTASDPRAKQPQVGGEDTRRPRLPPEIECPICRGSGGAECEDCGGTGGDSEKRPCGLCEGTGEYTCYTCDGSGRKLLGRCKTCGGSGDVSCEKCGGTGTETIRNLCPGCEGTGHLCHRCGGLGQIKLY